MATRNCSICEERGKTSSPEVCSLQCEESLCLTCSKRHLVQRITRDHNTISYEDYNGKAEVKNIETSSPDALFAGSDKAEPVHTSPMSKMESKNPAHKAALLDDLKVFSKSFKLSEDSKTKSEHIEENDKVKSPAPSGASNFSSSKKDSQEDKPDMSVLTTSKLNPEAPSFNPVSKSFQPRQQGQVMTLPQPQTQSPILQAMPPEMPDIFQTAPYSQQLQPSAQQRPPPMRAINNPITMSDAGKEGSLYDLEDNEKRWILIGIDLHKIIAPALRKYVKSRLDQVWQSLKNSDNIDAQQYPNQLKRYLTTFLNYEAINNNKVHGLRQQSQYDYSVKDSVDLSKLFLKTDMAHYTAFDDSCDSSALLGIVINTGICPDGKPCADKVRSEIRNRWAHSNFTEWDDTKYQDSLQLMEQLVKSLGLSKEDENETFSQLDRWKKNGKEFIEGTTPESVALKDISKQFQTMVVWTKHLEQDIQEKIRELTEKRVPPIFVQHADKVEIHYHGSYVHK